MQRLKMKAELRDETGSRPSRRLREHGEIPAVLYGNHHTPVALSVNTRDIRQMVGKNALIDLEFGDEVATVILKDLQQGIQRDYIHADLQAVDLGQLIHINVPVHLQGVELIQRSGGTIQHILSSVEVECMPTDIPEYFSIDVSDLEVGDSLFVRNLVLENETPVMILTPANDVIATITSMADAQIEVEGGSQTGIATMPEVIPQKHDAKAERAANREEIEYE